MSACDPKRTKLADGPTLMRVCSLLASELAPRQLQGPAQREAVMVRLVKTTLTVGYLFATSVGTSYASGWEINNIWWDVRPNFRGGGQTVCVAEQFNNETFVAVTFDVYPVHGRHGTATQRDVNPNVRYRIFGWRDGTKPEPKCVLTSWRTKAKRVTAPPPVPSWRLFR